MLYVLGNCTEFASQLTYLFEVKCEGCQIHNLNCEKGNSKLHGFGRDGFFAEYATVDYRNAIILPPSLDIKTSAPIFCAGVTGMWLNLLFSDSQPLTWINLHSTSCD